MSSAAPANFMFSAQTAEGEPLSGSIDASTLDEANRRLQALQLRVLSLQAAPAAEAAARPARRLAASDFQLLNTQLAHLTSAGLPVEHGLRLIAEDMRAGRFANVVRAMAVDLEAGQPLDQVLQRHSGHFPPLYAQLVKAGINIGNLPGVLLNLGRHLEVMGRMRANLWRALAYPAFVAASLVVVLLVLGLGVFPQFEGIFSSFHTQLPAITQAAMACSQALVQGWRWLALAAVLLLVGVPTVWWMLGRANQQQRFLELVVFPLPVIGRALRWNLLARWTDALKLGVEAGLDLPAALELAADTVSSPGLRRDGAALTQALQAGQPVDQNIRTRLVPPTLLAVLSLASTRQNLPTALQTLSRMFQQQAEVRIALIPVTLTPILIVLIGAVILTAVVAMFAPLISLIQAVSGH